MTSPTFLVTGASGHLGNLVLNHLIETKAGHIIAGSRDPAKLKARIDQGIEVRKVDFDDPDLATAFSGVDRLLIISTDALDRPGRRLEQHKAAIAAAVKASVGHVIYTSMPNPEPGSAVTFAFEHYGTEEALKASGLNYTILRNAWYAENLLLSLPHALATGQWFSAAADGRNAYVTRDDLAHAAAHALVKAPKNVTFTLTGPQGLTTAEIAALAGETFGRSISVIPVSDAQFEGGLKAAGIPDFLTPMLTSFETNTRQGGFDIVTNDIESLTGQRPQTLGDFLRAHKDDFALA